MNRPFLISVVIASIFLVVLEISEAKDLLWAHPWLRGFLVALPTIGLAVVGLVMQSRLSRESDALRIEANQHRARANELQEQLDAERNKHLQQIAQNTQREVTPAEKNAATLRKYLGANLSVKEGDGYAPSAPLLVDINEDNIATFFSPSCPSSVMAWSFQAHGNDLQITEIPEGSCPARVKVLKRYGNPVQHGELKNWNERFLAAAAPVFAKGGMSFHATYGKPGSSERRSLHVFASADNSNSFLLEASTGETTMGSNVEISKRFTAMHVDYLAAGFNRSSSGSGGSPYPLFISV